MATATDDNAEIRNLDARLFQKSTCWHTSCREGLFFPNYSILESQCIIYQNYMDSAFVTGISCNQELAAYCIRGFAVEAFAGFFAWSFDIESLGIGWGCYISGTFHCCVKVGTDFVHSHDEYYFSWTLGNAGDTIGISINVDHNAIACDCICAGKEYICIICRHKAFSWRHFTAVKVVVIAIF